MVAIAPTRKGKAMKRLAVVAAVLTVLLSLSPVRAQDVRITGVVWDTASVASALRERLAGLKVDLELYQYPENSVAAIAAGATNNPPEFGVPAVPCYRVFPLTQAGANRVKSLRSHSTQIDTFFQIMKDGKGMWLKEPVVLDADLDADLQISAQVGCESSRIVVDAIWKWKVATGSPVTINVSVPAFPTADGHYLAKNSPTKDALALMYTFRKGALKTDAVSRMMKLWKERQASGFATDIEADMDTSAALAAARTKLGANYDAVAASIKRRRGIIGMMGDGRAPEFLYKKGSHSLQLTWRELVALPEFKGLGKYAEGPVGRCQP